MDYRTNRSLAWRRFTLKIKKPILFGIISGFFAVSVQAQILPQPAPLLDVTAKKYRGLNTNPKVMRRYMLDYLELYVHQYVKDFKEMNHLEQDVLNEKELLFQFRKDINSIPDSMILSFSPLSVEILKGRLDATAIKVYPKNTYAEIQESLGKLEVKVSQLENEIEILKQVLKIGDNDPSQAAQHFDVFNQLKQMKTDLTLLSDRIRQQQTAISSISKNEPKEPAPPADTKKKSAYWIAIMALILSLISFFASTRAKKNTPS